MFLEFSEYFCSYHTNALIADAERKLQEPLNKVVKQIRKKGQSADCNKAEYMAVRKKDSARGETRIVKKQNQNQVIIKINYLVCALKDGV